MKCQPLCLVSHVIARHVSFETHFCDWVELQCMVHSVAQRIATHAKGGRGVLTSSSLAKKDASNASGRPNPR